MKIKALVKNNPIAVLDTNNLHIAIDFIKQLFSSTKPYLATCILIDAPMQHVLLLSERQFYIDGDTYDDFIEMTSGELSNILYTHLGGE